MEKIDIPIRYLQSIFMDILGLVIILMLVFLIRFYIKLQEVEDDN